MTTTVAIPGLKVLVVGRPHTAVETPSVEQLLATSNGMRRWLAKLDARAEVGQPGSIWHCPIATYLNAMGVEGVAVASEKVRWADPADPNATAVRRLPLWAAEFVALVDTYTGQPIRASLAITLLYEAVREACGR